jgi:GT2 family glycosyltransferase
LFSQSPRLAIVILNYNGYKDTIACLESVCSAAPRGCVVIVVDNFSPDDSVPELKRWMQNCRAPLRESLWGGIANTCTPGDRQAGGRPGVVLLEARNNSGFSGGNNLGIRYALQLGVAWILLLNNDTIVRWDSLERLVEGAEGAGAHLAGCTIYEYADPCKAWYLGGRFGWWADRDLKCLPKGVSEAQGTIETDWITGCCMLIKREVFERVGLLDENSFLYCEDADFCRRAARVGFRRILVLGSRIYHKAGRSAGVETALVRYHATRSRVYFHQKHYWFPAHAGFLFVFALSRWFKGCCWLLQGRPDLAVATLRGLWDGMLGKVRASYP